jgi:hypothetical protein
MPYGFIDPRPGVFLYQKPTLICAYKPREILFTDAVPLRYRGCEVPGVNISPRGMRSIACTHRGDILLHLVNMEGISGPLTVELRGWIWDGITSARLEPEGKDLEVKRNGAICRLTVEAEDVDPVDTMIRLSLETSR